MAIPESQLQVWSNQGATVTSSSTYTAVQSALSAHTSPVKDLISSNKVEVYLQGSYAGYTNIYGDSDVDIIVLLKNTFTSNKLLLPTDQFKAHEATYSPASYSFPDFRRDVILALERYFTADYVDTTGNKSLKVLAKPGRLSADVVPVVSYRQYVYFQSDAVHHKIEGVSFNHKTKGNQVINFPKLHLKHGSEKNKNANNNFKPLVRIFKNARSYLIDNNFLEKEKAPSYFLQNLVYNIPDEIISQGSWNKIYPDALNFLAKADKTQFICQNHQHTLFGASEEQWNMEDADETIRKLIELWNSWYE